MKIRSLDIIIFLLLFLLPQLLFSQRKLNYVANDGAFVSVNGKNKFTRALYGGTSAYRVETSDMPVLALFQDSKNSVNVSLSINDVDLSTCTYCKSKYALGMRQYEVCDDRIYRGSPILLKVVCLNDEDCTIIQVSSEASQELTLNVRITGVRGKKMSRNGDLGVDACDVFESDGVLLKSQEYRFVGKKNIKFDGLTLSSDNEEITDSLFEVCLNENKVKASMVQFHTPDPYINAVGTALVFAADGAWDGETWLHGAIGWRTPLAGWRGGYLGDVIGWHDRSRSHFDAYAKSQVCDIPISRPHPTQSEGDNLARAEKTWGTPMYSNGYICRKPGKNDIMHHYDMNLNYIDELLWHFSYDADTAYMKKMWPVIKSHLLWEKVNNDPDGDHLYDAYCCIWASDGLYYNGGAVTHSSSYNYRANLVASKIASIIGEDGEPYITEANAIRKAMNERLWIKGNHPHWAEYQDLMGKKRVHADAAVWSEYTPVDCGVCTPLQARLSMSYIDREIPHISVDDSLMTISTSDWMPYVWSINNVASAEVMHTALAFFKAGMPDKGYSLLKANIMDQMFYGHSPGNYGQISQFDAARGECYRDFADNTGISARVLIQGLFGIVPDALNGKCYIRPGFPESWDSVKVVTPYLSYEYHKGAGRYEDCFNVKQNFPQKLQIIIEDVRSHDTGEIEYESSKSIPDAEIISLTTRDPLEMKKERAVNLNFNAKVNDIFRNDYLSPRPPYTTLQIPRQGVGEWCHPKYVPEINDSAFRSVVKDGKVVICGTTFRTPSEGKNVLFCSLWDNYPDSTMITLDDYGDELRLLMVGSTNHMQTRIVNAHITIEYSDGESVTYPLTPPYNWCPVEQDYYIDEKAFNVHGIRPPLRVSFGDTNNGKLICSREIGREIGITGVYGREIRGGAAQVLCLPLDPHRRLLSATLVVDSNDIVVGIMSATICQSLVRPTH